MSALFFLRFLLFCFGFARVGFDVAQHMIEQHRKTPFLFSFLIGDLCYAGTGGHDEWEPIWDMYGHQMEPLSTDIPFVTGVGNHEKYYNFTAFRARYEMPGDQSSGRGTVVPDSSYR